MNRALLPDDFLTALADWSDPVVLPGGQIVGAVPAVATSMDQTGGDTVVAGRTRTLLLEAREEIQEGKVLTWAGRQWRIIRVEFFAAGLGQKVYLGAV